MLEFYYQGRDKSGAKVDGKMFALTSAAVATQLLARGITPIDIKEYQEQRSVFIYLRRSFQPKIKLLDLMLFTRQLFALHKAGIPLNLAMQRIAETLNHPVLREILSDVADRISSGETLAAALQHHEHALPRLFIPIIKAGESSGRLEEALHQLHGYLELEETTKARIKTALRYPTFVLIAIVVALLVINFLVIPAFAALFAQFKTELPLPTRIILAVSNFMIQYWPILLVCLIGIIVLTIAYVNTQQGRLYWHRLQRNLPVLGPIFSNIHTIRFARIFAMMFRTGIAIVEGLRLLGQAVGNDHVTRQIVIMQQRIEHGSTLTQAAQQAKILSPLTLQMFAVGEETGQLDDMLDQVAEYYEREVEYNLHRLTDAIEPILLGVIGVMVLILALGVFLPMWDIASLMRAK
ncbi:MAG: type II secretion system F family protein [Gammaproteobacteria bacterium]